MDMHDFARTRVAHRDLRAEPEFPADLWKAMAEAGLFRVGLPLAHGGDGGGYGAIAAHEAALIEAGGSPGLGGAWASHQMVARYFFAGFADPALQAAYLPGLASGRLTASVAISEPGAGAHPKHLRTVAERHGDGFVLNGEKAYITNGPIADLYVVLAITAVEDGRKRYSAFVVPRDTAGLAPVAMREIDALRPALHCGLRFTDCAVPAANRIGPADGAYEAMALPFRDVEDAVGTAGTVGSLRYVLRRLGALTPAQEAATLGAAAALVALMRHGSDAIVAALDAEAGTEATAAILVGIRVLAADVLARLRQLHETLGGADARVRAVCESLDVSLSVARSARLARQARLGQALLPAA